MVRVNAAFQVVRKGVVPAFWGGPELEVMHERFDYGPDNAVEHCVNWEYGQFGSRIAAFEPVGRGNLCLRVV